MVRRGEEQSTKVPGTAALPSELGAAIPQVGRAIAVAGEATVFVLEPDGDTTPRLVREVGPETLVLVDPNCRDGVAHLVAALTCERAGAESPRAVKVDAEWCFAW
jgi:hypothetical protein